MDVLLTLTVAGPDTGPFDLYSNVDGYTAAFETGVDKASLLAGYLTTFAPSGTATVRVKSTGLCDNFIDIVLTVPTTTTTTTTILYYTLNGCSESDPPYSTTVAPVLVNQRYILTTPLPVKYYVWNNNPGTALPLTTPNPSIQIVSGQSGCPT
jgi:hypothetical protein